MEVRNPVMMSRATKLGEFNPDFGMFYPKFRNEKPRNTRKVKELESDDGTSGIVRHKQGSSPFSVHSVYSVVCHLSF